MPEPWRSPDSGCGWGLYRRHEWSELDDWDRMTPAVDCVLLTVDRGQLRTLVYRRDNTPQRDRWAIPGVFLNYGEREEQAVARALKTKCGLDYAGFSERLDWSWSKVRDPRGWVGTGVFLALAELLTIEVAIARLESPKRRRVALAHVSVPPDGGQAVEVTREGQRIGLAFDHNRLVGLAVSRLRADVISTSVALELMPETFTLREFQTTFEAVLGFELSVTSFRRLVVENLHLIEPAGPDARVRGGRHRPPALYRRS